MISIIIPTRLGVQHSGTLKECLQSICDYTDLSEGVEIIIVANGCNTATHLYLHALPVPFFYLWYPEPLGFAKAVNIGIQNCKGDYIVILNDDIILLSQTRNNWIQRLSAPFKDPQIKACGVVGIHSLIDPITKALFVPYYCVMFRKDVFDKVGLLDEQFNLGGCEDIDHCVRIQEAGYCVVSVARRLHVEREQMVGDFPIYHYAEKTAQTIPNWNDNFQKNQELLKKKWEKYLFKVVVKTEEEAGENTCIEKPPPLPLPLKLNIGCGDMVIPGWIGVDKYYEKADQQWDAIDLPLPKNSVDEIYSSHLIEHFHFHDGEKVLKEWYRVLKPGGILTIETPDLLATCKKFVESDEQGRIALYPQLFGYPWDKGQTHLFVYTPTQLRWSLEQIGFKDIHQEPALRWTNIVDTCMKFVCKK
jgi:predicted SAM-dependent methyltransferase/GT2 family glycosyltransferase